MRRSRGTEDPEHREGLWCWLAVGSAVNGVSLVALLVLLVAANETLVVGVRPRVGEALYLQSILFAQCMLEITSVALAGSFLCAAGAARVARALVGLAFALPALTYVDALVMVRIDRHLGSIVGLLLDARRDDSRRLLEATGIDARAVLAFLGGVGIIAVAGAWIDRATEPLSARVGRRFPRARLRRGGLIVAWTTSFIACGALEAGAAHCVRADSWARFGRRVPQVLGVLGPVVTAKASIRGRLRPRRSETSVAAVLGRLDMPRESPQGDLFFFVVDSLRGDAIDETTAPALAALGRESLRFDVAVSGGNVTHYGWYTLFWSDTALDWRLNPGPEEREGAVPLRIARQLGWRIEVLSSADLGYMHLDGTILGQGHRLADDLVDLHAAPGNDADHDAQVVRELVARIGRAHAPTAYLVFLDAVHLPYLWTDDFVPPWRPYAGLHHYLSVQRTQVDRGAVMNRYRDAVTFVDSVIGRFIAALRAGGGYDSSTLVVVGDHGEEFWEHDLASHGSEPCGAQTHVALLLKPPRAAVRDGDWSSPKPFVSTMDVWPTILDAAGVRGDQSGLYDGASIARTRRRAALAASQRYWYPPARFVLEDGGGKVLMELSRPDEAFVEQDVRILAVLDEHDLPQELDLTPSQYLGLVRRRFGADLERFFIVRW